MWGSRRKHDRETENIPGIVLRPQPVVVEGSEGGPGRWGGEVNKIKKTIIRPQHKPCNYAPKFNQNSFPHWACNYLTSPVRFCLPGPSLEIPQSLESFCRARLKGGDTLPAPPTPSPSHHDRLIGLGLASGKHLLPSPPLPIRFLSASHLCHTHCPFLLPSSTATPMVGTFSIALARSCGPWLLR